MELQAHNMVEEEVRKETLYQLSKTNNICKCNQCVADITAIALNNLKPIYVVTHKGETYTRIKEMEVQFMADVTREVAKALAMVSREPHHDVE